MAAAPRGSYGVMMLDPVRLDLSAIRADCEVTLRRDWRKEVRPTAAVPHTYRRPSPAHSPFQWYWESCFTAIAWRHLKAGRSRAELETLPATPREDGFIGQTTFWDTPLNERRPMGAADS